MNTEELLHHIEVMQSFEPIKDLVFIHNLFGLLAIALIVVGIACNFIPSITAKVYKVIISVVIMGVCISIIIEGVIVQAPDYHKEWGQFEGYSSITLVSEFLNGSAGNKKMSVKYVEDLISKGNKLIKESEELKIKMALIETRK